MIDYPVTLKRRGWSTSSSVLVVLALLAGWFVLPKYFFLGAVAIAILYALSVIVRFAVMNTYELRIKDEWLIENDSHGQEVARLQLNKQFKAECVSEGYDNAVYKLIQGDTRLRFSTQTPGAKYVVTDILKLQWPPAGLRWW